MKTISANLATHIALEVTSLATCWKLVRTDGTILTFTDHDQDIVFDLGDGDGSLTYVASTGYDRTAIAGDASFDVDNLDIEGILESTEISKIDIRAGLYDNAEVKIFMVNWKDLTMDELKLKRGFVGELAIRDNLFVGELRGLAQKYTQEIGDVITPECRADLFDTKCKVRDLPSTWTASTAYTVRTARDANTGSVARPSTFNDRQFKASVAGTSGGSEPSWDLTLGNTTADNGVTWVAIQAPTIESASVSSVTTNRRIFIISSITDAPDAFITEGNVTFLTGSNTNLKMEVKTFVQSSHTVSLFLPMPFDISSGDTLNITAGCNKKLAVCRDTWDNVDNFRGEPHLPGNDLLFKTPNATS